MCEGSIVGGHIVEGLRTEMPFHLSREIDLGGIIGGDGRQKDQNNFPRSIELHWKWMG